MTDPVSVVSELPALAADAVSKRYGATVALAGASLFVRQGEVHGLVGANGAGKSTLIKILSGAEHQDSGRLRLGAWSGSGLTPRSAQARGLETIYQDLSVAPWLDGVANVILGQEHARLGMLAPRRQRTEVLGIFARLGFQAGPKEPVNRLSPADQQLVAIARAIYRRASVVLMDEPTSSLGITERARLLDVVRELSRDGVAVVYISHDLEEVLAVAHRVTVLRDGRTVDTVAADQVTPDDLVERMVGGAFERLRRASGTAGEVALELCGIGQHGRLADIDLQLRRGEVVGLTGLVGSGRTRLANVLAGLHPATAGEMTVDGRPYRPRTPGDALRAGLVVVPEDRKRDSLLMDLASTHTVMLARPESRLGLLRGRAERTATKRLMDRLHVKPASPAAVPRAMSGGNQQKVSLAKALQARPRVVVLDEPGQGVDIGAKQQILHAIREMAADGCAVLVISSELQDLVPVVDRLLVMRRGRISGELAAAEIDEHRVLELAVTGGSHRPDRDEDPTHVQ
ncbi:ribose transport system ATP-binding protein/rhamnose transport system ATP-binding protein [Amycolatopsis sulphurea]|uniref:Ribose transport system ATP-binding protein/rhamnose transport system ATP-binding protein n=1 Tax=Amycolatopsis sulphurea TaxID=76022 RepID=A0A2A9FGY6_9PSEU|nr:sugar ABC transporter ATP-binding protein [Amycolatopsis sulphurea]PFG50727.1 ribose transport system ATP-binding protein/rhamnose transport system ATP-binding protein [Amycolatopsis sulphurea]